MSWFSRLMGKKDPMIEATKTFSGHVEATAELTKAADKLDRFKGIDPVLDKKVSGVAIASLFLQSSIGALQDPRIHPDEAFQKIKDNMEKFSTALADFQQECASRKVNADREIQQLTKALQRTFKIHGLS